MCGGGRVQQLFHGVCKLSESPSCSQRACLLPVSLHGNVRGLIRNVTHVDTVLSFMKETHRSTMSVSASSYGLDSCEAQGCWEEKWLWQGTPSLRSTSPHAVTQVERCS